MPIPGEPIVSRWKPSRVQRKKAERRTERQRRLTRSQVREIVYRRERMICERCHRPVKGPDDSEPWEDDRAQVNERVPKSRGGDPLDPDNCELTCRRCHFGGPSGAHAPTKARMKRI